MIRIIHLSDDDPENPVEDVVITDDMDMDAKDYLSMGQKVISDNKYDIKLDPMFPTGNSFRKIC
jgi:hypothetical protein